jgi:hypothetical protein
VATWRGTDGIQVEVILLDSAPRYKITQVVGRRRYLLAYTATVDGLAAWVDLADLVEVIPFPAAT